MSITWLIGKSNNVDLLWSAYENEITKNPDIIRNINLFEEKKYKYIYDKKNQKFFKQPHLSFHNELIVKGITTFDGTIMDEKEDKIIYTDLLDKYALYNLFCKISKIKFLKKEIEFIKKLNSLEDLSTIITLKKLDLEMEFWPNFLIKEKENWYQKLKERKLILSGIFHPTQIIPVIIYAINSGIEEKPILLFLNGKIKQGYPIWEFTKIWQSCVKNTCNGYIK